MHPDSHSPSISQDNRADKKKRKKKFGGAPPTFVALLIPWWTMHPGSHSPSISKDNQDNQIDNKIGYDELGGNAG
jgi:hypothetical protein